MRGRLIWYGFDWRQLHVPASEVNPLRDRIYRLQPYGEAAEVAWQMYALDNRQAGNMQLADLWQQRADDARTHSLYPGRPFDLAIDRALLFVWATLLAAIVLLVVRFVRYAPRLGGATGEKSASSMTSDSPAIRTPARVAAVAGQD